MRLVGLIALSDPPREESSELIADLRDMGVRTVMVTGDSGATAAAIAGRVGIAGAVCPPERFSDELATDDYGVFARVVPEEKFRLVKALQHHGHVVGMCGDGVNDAPALRQAQIGIAVASATDVAKAAAGMVLTEPGLAGIVHAVREGRIGFQRLLAFTFNMLVKKTEIVLFLAIGLVMTGHGVLTPALMVLLFVTNDFLAMSLTTDRASPAPRPASGACAISQSPRSCSGRASWHLLDGDPGGRKVPTGVRCWRAADPGLRHARVRQPGRSVRAARAAPDVELPTEQLDCRRFADGHRDRGRAGAFGHADGAAELAHAAGRLGRGDGICADSRSDQAAGHGRCEDGMTRLHRRTT